MVLVYFTATLSHNMGIYLDQEGLHTKGLLNHLSAGYVWSVMNVSDFVWSQIKIIE